MKITETALPGVLLFHPAIYSDSRGEFWETWNRETFAQAGLPSIWAQDNFSVSKKNVLRGIHYQVINPQGKLVRVTHGAALDVVVDLRRSSPSFGKHVAIELSGERGEVMWIPEGFGHAFLALTEEVGFAYKVTDFYSPAGERTILWRDPELAIQWPINPANVTVSEKDSKGKLLSEAEVFP